MHVLFEQFPQSALEVVAPCHLKPTAENSPCRPPSATRRPLLLPGLAAPAAGTSPCLRAAAHACHRGAHRPYRLGPRPGGSATLHATHRSIPATERGEGRVPAGARCRRVLHSRDGLGKSHEGTRAATRTRVCLWPRGSTSLPPGETHTPLRRPGHMCSASGCCTPWPTLGLPTPQHERVAGQDASTSMLHVGTRLEGARIVVVKSLHLRSPTRRRGLSICD